MRTAGRAPAAASTTSAAGRSLVPPGRASTTSTCCTLASRAAPSLPSFQRGPPRASSTSSTRLLFQRLPALRRHAWVAVAVPRRALPSRAVLESDAPDVDACPMRAQVDVDEARRPTGAVRRRPRRRVRAGAGPRRGSSATTPSPGRAASRGRSPTPASSASPPTASGCPTCPRVARRCARPGGRRGVHRGLRDLAAPAFVGDALLPRFVVFGIALLLPDWYRLCVGWPSAAGARRGARPRRGRGRRPTRSPPSSSSSTRSPERPASIVAQPLASSEAAARRRARTDRAPSRTATRPPCSCSTATPRTTRASSPRPPSLHERGVRVRTLTLFYEEWLGKLPISELERASMLFDIGEVHRAGYGRAKRLLDVAAGAGRAACVLVVVAPVRAGSATSVGNRGPAASTARSASARAARTFTILKFRTMAPGAPTATRRASGPREDDPRITRFGRVLRAHPPRRAPAGGQHPRGATSASSGPAPSSRTTSPSSTEKLPVLPAAPPRAPGAHRAGRR